MAEIELTPTEQMASNAKRGLELRRKHKRGGTSVGVARARDISNRKNLSPETVSRMHAFFSRHEKNKAGGEDDAGYIAWLLWGGDAGKSWAARKVEQLERKDENMMSETRKAIMERLGMAAMNHRPGAKAKMGANEDRKRAAGYKWQVRYTKQLGKTDYLGGSPQVIEDTVYFATESAARDWANTMLGKGWFKGMGGSPEKVLTAKVLMFSRPGVKARFEENCGTGAGGFKPGNTCGAEEGKGGGGAPEAKKRKRKPKRTPLAGPKVEKPAKIPSVNALLDLTDESPEYSDAWRDAEEALASRADPQAKALRKEMSALLKRWEKLTDVITEMEWGPSRKNRSATKRKATADELNLLQQRAKRIIRDAQKTEKTAKRSRVEQAGELIGQTIKAQDSIAFYETLKDVSSAIDEARKRGGAGSGKMRKSLKAMEEEWSGLEREVEVINSDYIDMKDQQPIDERQARALKQRAGQLLQKTGDWRKRAQALVGQAKARASRTGDKRLMAAAVRAQKILARRPGPRTRFGFLSRIGRAATALTARPADTTAPDYAKQVEEAKKAAISEVNGYRFLRDKVVARQQAMDAYVKQAAAAIAKSRVAPDIRHFTDQISTAVKAQQMMLMAVKTPFGRKGAKARFGYADAQVVGGDIVWPSGMTLKILSHSTLEQKSKEMQDAIKRNRSAWIADYKLRGPKGATYSLDVYANGTYILTPHNNPRPMLRGQLKMSRPGAKAKMGKASDALNYIKNSIASGKTVYVTAGSRTTKVTPQTYAKWEASGRPLFKLGGDGALLMASGSSYVRLTMGEDMMLAGITAMSRPGAKARMGKDRFCDVTSTPLPTKADQRKQEFSHHAPGDRVMVTHDGQEVRGVVMRVMEDGGYIVDMGAKGSARFADSEVSAVREGEKLSAAAGDEAVSEKIRTLVAEGKPQDQAVAIALDMKRRGEL